MRVYLAARLRLQVFDFTSDRAPHDARVRETRDEGRAAERFGVRSRAKRRRKMSRDYGMMNGCTTSMSSARREPRTIIVIGNPRIGASRETASRRVSRSSAKESETRLFRASSLTPPPLISKRDRTDAKSRRFQPLNACSVACEFRT